MVGVARYASIFQVGDIVDVVRIDLRIKKSKSKVHLFWNKRLVFIIFSVVRAILAGKK